MDRSRSIYATKAWQAASRQAKERDLWRCQMCGVAVEPGRKGLTAAHVDHVIPLRLRPDLAFDLGNLRTVCARCHNGPCRSIEDRFTTADEIADAKLQWRPVAHDATGRPLDPSHPWNQGGAIETSNGTDG